MPASRPRLSQVPGTAPIAPPAPAPANKGQSTRLAVSHPGEARRPLPPLPPYAAAERCLRPPPCRALCAPQPRRHPHADPLQRSTGPVFLVKGPQDGAHTHATTAAATGQVTKMCVTWLAPKCSRRAGRRAEPACSRARPAQECRDARSLPCKTVYARLRPAPVQTLVRGYSPHLLPRHRCAWLQRI